MVGTRRPQRQSPSTWPTYYNSYQSSHSPAASSDADEWLITPAIDFPDAEKLYTVSIDAASTRGYGSEAFEIVMAKSTTLEAMRQGRTILDEPAITAPDFVACSSRFGIPEAGKWHVGIHYKVATRCRVAHRPEEPEDMHHRNLLLHPRHMHRPQREARPQSER